MNRRTLALACAGLSLLTTGCAFGVRSQIGRPRPADDPVIVHTPPVVVPPAPALPPTSPPGP